MNDSRLNINTILTSTLHGFNEGMIGSNLINYAKVESLLKNQKGRIEGVKFTDKLSNK